MPIPTSKVSKPIPLPRLKQPISLQRPVPLPRSKKPISLTRIENDIIEDNIIKDAKNLKFKKENKAIKEKIIKDIRNFFVSEKEDYYKPEMNGNAFNNNYI